MFDKLPMDNGDLTDEERVEIAGRVIAIILDHYRCRIIREAEYMALMEREDLPADYEFSVEALPEHEARELH